NESEAALVLDHIFDGRPLTAMTVLDSLQPECDGEPLFLLMRARCYQEQIPMDDANTTRGKQLSEPSLVELDKCIDVCSRQLQADNPDPIYYYYRGWAWMAKAYVRSMTRSLYKAGRDAGRGKKDLERYLTEHPNDPTANGLLGSFLYFADTIPDAFKFLSKLLRLPTGDRVRGLELLEASVRVGGLLETDWRLILYNVYFYFEGRYEEGLAGLQQMNQRHPRYPRTAIPLAVSRLCAPQLADENNMMVTETVNRLYAAPHQEVDSNALHLVQFYRAYGDRYCNNSKAALTRLRTLIQEAPRHPDWVEYSARLELGRLYASRGDRRSAAELFEAVRKNGSPGYLRDEAKALLKDIETYNNYADPAAAADIDSWVATLYEGDPDSLRALESRFKSIAAGSLIAKFYLAETLLLAGELENAFQFYSEIVQLNVPRWDHTYQMIGCTRIAEIYAAKGRYESAARWEAYAMNFYHGEYLMDWVIEGRQRYFDRLAKGEETVPPTLLISSRLMPPHRSTHH
ncbi:MAG: hypothetical protein JSW50_02535, partial [Candidatus Latescibacterota bacterium]